MKLNFQTVRFAADAIRMLNGATLSVNGLYSIAGVVCLIAAGINFTSTIKNILEPMGEIMDTLKEGAFPKITPKAVFALSPEYAHLPDGLKFVYAMVALLSEGKYDVIISAPNRGIEMENLRPLRTELPAVSSDISIAMRGFKDHSLHMLVLD